MADQIEIAEEAEAMGGLEYYEDQYANYTAEDLCFNLNFSELERLNFTEACSNRISLPAYFMNFIQVLYALICVVGLCGNTLVIYVVLRYSKMQTVTYIYILMLAVADEIFLLGIPFLIVTSVKSSWIFGLAMCKIYLTTTSINQFTSSIFLTVLSADRYIAVCHPISAPKYRTPVIARCVSLTAWAASALLMVPVFMYAATMARPDGGWTCNIFWPHGESSTSDMIVSSLDNITSMMAASDEEDSEYERPLINEQTAFTMYSFMLGFAIPLSLILIFYAQVIFKLRTVGPKSNSAVNNGKSSARKKSHAKVTRLVLTVITVYIFCWLPYWITQLSLIFTQDRKSGPQSSVFIAVMLLAGCLSYSNSAINPVLYAFLSDNFKKSFMKACTCSNRGEVNAALHVEHSLFPRKRSLLGRAKKGHQDKKAARNRLLAGGGQGKEANADKMEAARQDANKLNAHNPDMIHRVDSQNDKHQHDMSTGMSISRTSRSCFNSTAGPTGTTTVPPSANVSMAQPELPDEDDQVCVINGNLAPPPITRNFSSPATQKAKVVIASSSAGEEQN